MGHLIGKLLIPMAVLLALTIIFPPNKIKSTASCAGPVDKKVLSQGFDPTATVGEFQGRLVKVPPNEGSTVASVLGESAGDKRIEVDLKNQRVYALEGNNRVFEFVVSTGKWAPTPRGIFTIGAKVGAQKMSGGDRAIGTYYYLPNVPWVMFFGNSDIPWSRGFSLHGTYWHNNFGTPMSHGCVNMKTPEAKTLYDWAPIGTKVVIY